MPVVAVFGPTASGKSAAALELAEAIGGEIVSCDAMQLYRGLPILTNQPSAEEQARVAHHLVAVWEPEHEGSVAEYAELAHAAIDDVLARGHTPIVVGGGGLYLRAALAPLRLPPAPADGQRDRLEAEYDRLGPDAAHALLAERDPRAAAAVHANDRRRVVRALELAEMGETLAPAQSELWEADPRHPVTILGLDVPRELLRERIAARTQAMFAAGVEDEVRAAIEAHTFSSTADRIHGLSDVRALVQGEIDREQAQRQLIDRTRQYAKRQAVWMRRIPGLRAVPGGEPLLAHL